MHEGKGATDTRAKGKDPYKEFCNKQGQVEVPIRMERIGTY